MAWAKMDDKRAMNKKLRAVGFEARGLDEAAIEQSVYDLSDGFVSTDTVETLAVAHHCKHWTRLVSALVSVGRWEVVDGGWVIHDYLEFNPSRAEWEADREKKRAAGQRGGQASAQARATADAQARAATIARAQGRPPATANAQADPTRPEKAAAASRTPTNDQPGDRPAAAAAEHQAGQNQAKAPVDLALRMLAVRHLNLRRTPVENPGGWLAGAVKGLRHDLADRLDTPEIESFSDPEKLAEWLEPSAENEPVSGRDYDRERVDCDTCGGSGWRDLDDDIGTLTVVPCLHTTVS